MIERMQWLLYSNEGNPEYTSELNPSDMIM